MHTQAPTVFDTLNSPIGDFLDGSWEFARLSIPSECKALARIPKHDPLLQVLHSENLRRRSGLLACATSIGEWEHLRSRYWEHVGSNVLLIP